MSKLLFFVGDTIGFSTLNPPAKSQEAKQNHPHFIPWTKQIGIQNFWTFDCLTFDCSTFQDFRTFDCLTFDCSTFQDSSRPFKTVSLSTVGLFNAPLCLPASPLEMGELSDSAWESLPPEFHERIKIHI